MYHGRTLQWSSWLGWQIDSNWASPPLFVLYTLVKPLCGCLLLVCMYWAAQSASGGSAPPGLLPFLYLSSACFLLVAGITVGMTQAVVTDRESYGMLKFVRISPINLRGYLIGRGVARAGQAVVGSGVTIAAGAILFPEFRAAFAAHGVAWGWLLLYLIAGLVMLVATGLILAAAVLQMARYGMFLSEGVAGVLYLLSGAVFPITVLPPWLRPLSYVLPPTYWLEGMRRALLGPAEPGSAFADWDHAHLGLALVGGSAALAGIAHAFFRWSEGRAWRLGRYDEVLG
jgi:ABC-2 type transport system permease protein